MGSWKRTITSPFRKACTILSPQNGGSRSDDQHGGSVNDGKKTPRTRHHLKRSGAAGAAAMAQGEVVESPSTTAQLYGDVMACAYEDVQVMWSMLDNKAKVVDTAAS
ncbi:hypothetical protein D1007_16478 [Hordeum vulgare]|uniref:Uncharacterized protein n=1 Tax=Hordeum vulgare subsp. vulgare TaxID=112509 RepID=A0A8I6WF21_HORVV|nr:uncharacterized protein LOC123407042 [Hordeum vulgare subsp. vulgare]KAE8807251.1 hypothetical protein D1007_16478 [Hordeum vulgare]KAI5022438.1 hypothetical protein ZWY2020_059168 [Hordeum vulgare]